jgi:hypothetical protein
MGRKKQVIHNFYAQMWKTMILWENYFRAVKDSSKTGLPFHLKGINILYVMKTTRILHSRKKIALVAHDHKKQDLIDWAEYNKVSLARHELFATEWSFGW